MSMWKLRWEVLYDQAAREYMEACKKKNKPNQRGWKKRLCWLDKKLMEDLVD